MAFYFLHLGELDYLVFIINFIAFLYLLRRAYLSIYPLEALVQCVIFLALLNLAMSLIFQARPPLIV